MPYGLSPYEDLVRSPATALASRGVTPYDLYHAQLYRQYANEALAKGISDPTAVDQYAVGKVQQWGIDNGINANMSWLDAHPWAAPVGVLAAGFTAGALGGGFGAAAGGEGAGGSLGAGAGASYGGAGDFASATGPSVSASEGLGSGASGGALTQAEGGSLGSGLSTQTAGQGLRIPTYPVQTGMGAQGMVVPSGTALGSTTSFINAPGVLAAAPSGLVGGSGFVSNGTTPALGDPSSFINRGAFNAAPASSSAGRTFSPSDLARLGLSALPSGGGMLGGTPALQQSPATLFVPVYPGALQPFMSR